jgi:hypothetical protein
VPFRNRLHHLADVDAVLDDRVTDGQVLERDLVADGDVLHARKRDRPILVEDEAGQRRARLHALDDHHRDRVLGVVQHAMNHRNLRNERRADPSSAPFRSVAAIRDQVNYIIYMT